MEASNALDVVSRYSGPANSKTKGLLVPGTIINLYNRPVTKSPAGPNGVKPENWSTTYSKTLTADDDPRLSSLLSKYGKDAAVLLPTVVNGKFLTDKEAVDRALKTGEHLGIFDKWQNAEPYATDMHNSQAAMGNFYGRTSTLPAGNALNAVK